MVALIKPQFEAGRAEVGKHGVVRDAGVHVAVCAAMVEFARSAGYAVCGLHYSPITGPKGNMEFLLYLKKSGQPGARLDAAAVCAVVTEAHARVSQHA